jgi:hypothetical protein
MVAAGVCLAGRARALTTEVATKLFWANVAFVGIAAIPVTWLVFTLHCTGRERLLHGWGLALLSVEPALAVALA